MPHELIRKYGESRLPRYTSYPTAPRFAPGIAAGTYGDWLSRIPAREAVSLYLHIPFCRSMCWYCGCHTSITQKDQPILDYLDVLKREIRLVGNAAGKRLRVGQIHFGGGTPTIMKPEEFLDLSAFLQRELDVTPTAGIAVEIDPRTLSRSMIGALGQSGVTRASLGVQSFDPTVQKAINRIQTAEQTANAVSGLRDAGIESINFDLIYGLPHQTVESCMATARTAIAMRPDRFAVFGYAHIPSFKKHQRLIDENALPDAAARHAQAEAIADTLSTAGYRRIGLDHFALPDDELSLAADNGRLHRNFQGYTTDACTTLIGLGASAIGRTADGYVQNEVAIGQYAQRIASGKLATAKGYRMTAEDRLRAAVIERLMCDFRADLPALCAAYGFEPDQLLSGNAMFESILEDGIADIADGVVSVRRDCRFVIRAVAASFDAYLDQSARTHSKAA